MGAEVDYPALGCSVRCRPCSALRPPPVESAAQEGTPGTFSPTHPLTICRLTLTSPNKRPHFPNPPRPGEPKTRLSSLPHPTHSPVTRSRKSSSSHARATLTLTAPDLLFRLPSFVRFSRRLSLARPPTHVLLSTARCQVHVTTSAARACERCARRLCFYFLSAGVGL